MHCFHLLDKREKRVKVGLKEQEKYQNANFQGRQDIFERAFARLGFSSGLKIDVYLQKCSPLCDSEAPALRFDRSRLCRVDARQRSLEGGFLLSGCCFQKEQTWWWWWCRAFKALSGSPRRQCEPSLFLPP